MNNVLVVGSINMDLVTETELFPQPGETVLGQSFSTLPGGKGANQAVAASRLGARVSMIGCVGGDAFGASLIEHLRNEGVDTSQIHRVDDVSTGVAAITVSQSENAIVVVAGANHALTEEHVLAAEAAFAAADVVIAQLEVPLNAVEAALSLAVRYRKPFILNPAPAVPLPPSVLMRVSLLTPNEHELLTLFPAQSGTWQQILAHHPQQIVMTHGAQGAWFADAHGELRHQPAFRVDAVDTTGAGDTFNGALAAFWDEDFPSLVRIASSASALSVTKKGAQGGMPTREQVTEFLRAQASR